MAQINSVALFPGQGSQYPGMAKPLIEHFPWTRELFEEASDALHENLLKLCLEGPEDALQLTFNAQPCILTTSFAWFRVLKKNLDFHPVAAGGHSLGEYSALLSAGALGLTDAVRLVRKRGELMQTAVPKGKGKMAALLGLSDEQVQALCAAATVGDSLVVPANFNAANQVVIAGHAEAVERAERIASDGSRPELKARKVVPLKVSAPFHCPLMKPAADAFAPFLKAVSWATSYAFPIAHNVDAKLRSSGDLVQLLGEQIHKPVLWTGCMASLVATQAPRFVELGPGKVLTGLGKRAAPEATFFAVDSLEDFQKLETAVREGT